MNILTNSQERLYKMLGKTDGILKSMGKEPYGTRKATYAEQKRMYESLTPDQLMNLIETQGLDSVNQFLAKFEEKQNGRI